ncbi:MAG: hypothetical protein SP1CHLAM54_08390 [Chlamydiia bacterium]|nr:hypothetical protein [Chlamydiia bacterium]MCH9615745.1 hypothetical protein [Chlamydiia bacterium]MCH9628852.1 hypothetical protein [Chlamydiia bacterium]
MGMEQALASVFKMNENTWKRHANPLSVWTRYATLPLLCLMIYSRIWIGYYYLPLLALGLIWLFYNPRAFPPPKTTTSWASRATFGERIWLARKTVPIPDNHRKMARNLAFCAALGKYPIIYGLIYLDVYQIIVGIILVNLFKSWFLDRMVWVYEDMKHIDGYKAWVY